MNGLVSHSITLFRDTTVNLQLSILPHDVLPNRDYAPFVLSLFDHNMQITWQLLLVYGRKKTRDLHVRIADNQRHLTSLLRLFSHVGALPYLIEQVLFDEIDTCNESPNSLFRQDSVYF